MMAVFLVLDPPLVLQMRSMSTSSVPCNCHFCGGKLVSRFVRRQHNALYGTGGQSLNSTAKVEVRTT